MPLTCITKARQRGGRDCPSSRVLIESAESRIFKWIVSSFENEPFINRSDGADISKGIWNGNESLRFPFVP